MANITVKLLTLLLVGVHVSAASPGQVHPEGFFSDTAKYACGQIYTSLGAEIVQYAGAEYDSAASAAWNLINAVEKPTCIVFPRKASHVQVAMKAIYAHKARYAVQAGGDSSPKGWNNVDAGVLIFFSNMTGLSYDEEKNTITLQPGLRWGDVITALEPQGVAPVGSRQTGVGMGLFLGGGVGFLSPQHGFAADTFKEIDVVLTNGELVTTSSNEHKDLFRALKGGLNRFGIVTRYEVQAIHTGRKEDKTWYGGTIRFPASSSEALLKAVARYVRTNKDPKAILFASIVSFTANGTLQIRGTAQIFYNGLALPTAIFGEILAIPATSTTLRPLSYFDVSNTLPRDNDAGSVQHFGGSALVGDETLFLDAYSHWLNYSQTFANDISLTVFGFTPIPQSQIDIGYQNGGNAIDPPAGPYTIILFKTTFLSNITSIPLDAFAGIQLLLKQVPRSPGKPLFIGECDASQDVFASYGDHGFLKRTYQKYDPTHFNLRHTDGPSGLLS